MTFGLKKAPGMLARGMNVLQTKVNCQFAFVHLDDTVILLRTPEEQIKSVRQVLSLLDDAGMMLTLNKCDFFTMCIDHLGCVIRPGILEVLMRTTEAVQGLEHLTDLT